MKNKTGIVMKIKGKHAYVMTKDGAFEKIKIGHLTPQIGEIFTGEAVQAVPIYKYAIAAASFLFVITLGTGAYAYNKPVTSIIYNGSTKIKLETNRWDRIVKVTPLDKSGEKLVKSIDIKNKKLSNGLTILLQESEKLNNKASVPDKNPNNNKEIKVSIETKKKNNKINVDKLKEEVNKHNIKLKIENEKDNKAESKDLENQKKPKEYFENKINKKEPVNKQEHDNYIESIDYNEKSQEPKDKKNNTPKKVKEKHTKKKKFQEDKSNFPNNNPLN
ncbi:hypothetical protein Q428_11100 [Fervidicella metallireducens AeB]|uniref:RsgI N-terminal anti-sigma domain-containing protein n=1 Tax=Fervidicella metallireducens AeB TaxID=1403537 RepID=A0A017RSW7_9CLOT|nr:anti-sigma factor domain-containing protein [Fervidicella metallireducens]EYE87853.1 hypothetical protein Q428_11100 [Fervidicella metallireducens AeB]